MNIVLKRIHMENFKIFQNITLNFSMITKIFAQNYRGKSSICDLFTWVLFGKSSTGNSEGKQFHPRRYDKDGIDIDHVDIIGELVLEVDGNEIIVRKVQSQKWVRKRGAEEETYEGDENSYFWNEVPVKEKDFKAKVAEIIDEEIFKMITNPHAFVSKKWEDQRKFLVEKVAQITDQEVISLDGSFSELAALMQRNTLEEIKAINKKALSGYKSQQEDIPIRIDEVSKQIIDMDFAEKELQLSALKGQLAEVEGKISDTSKSYEEVNRLKAGIAEIKGKMEDIERVEKDKLSNQRNTLRRDIGNLDMEICNRIARAILNAKDQISVKQKSVQRNTEFLAESRRQYTAVKAEISTVEAKQFDEVDTICPTCRQHMPVEQITAIRSKYEVEKAKRIDVAQKKLDGVVEQGNLFDGQIEKDKADIAGLEKKLTEYEAEKAELEKQLADARAELGKLPSEIDIHKIVGYEELAKQYDNLHDVVLPNAIAAINDVDILKQSLLDSKLFIQNQIDAVKTELSKKQQIEDAKDRVAELKAELRQATASAAQCEKLQFTIENFEKAKMDLLSERINRKFKVVSWKLWNKLKNGGIEPCCVCMIHGSVYGENTTSSTEQLMAGMDIIATLQDIYSVKAPIFIDNKERFNDWNIPNMDCQMILLSVSEDLEIRVEG